MPLAPEDRHDAFPAIPCGTGVLLLAGSSGRIESERAALLAEHGARVRAIRWFGGRGQRPAPHEVPIELFALQLDALRQDSDRIAVVGTSFGAEAALVTASLTAVDATVAFSPSSVVWSGLADGDWSSHWTWHGAPLPAVAFDPDWTPDADPPEYLSLYTSSLALDPARSAAAEIPVERIGGALLLTAGGDDRVWPSSVFAAALADRRRRHGLATTVVGHPAAGHRVLLPGENRHAGGAHPHTGGVRMGRGGTPAADAELGARVWRELRRTLRLR